MQNSKPTVTVAGHLCLDITPAFYDKKISKIDELMKPGGVTLVGGAVVHVGGCVANTGLALEFFGADTRLMGKIGRDEFGSITQSQVSQKNTNTLVLSENENTSYTVVISPPGFDRFFIHHPGVNDSFGFDDIDFETVGKSSLFHLGYPPMLKKLYQNDGEELVRILKTAKQCGVITSLDMVSTEPGSEAASADWQKIMQRALPYVDFFVPSACEIAALADAERYCEWTARETAGDIEDTLSIVADIAPLAQKLLDWGTGAVLIKCGIKGLYLATSAAPAYDIDYFDSGSWADIRHHELCYKPDRLLSATGAGDTSIAAFLYSMLVGCPWQKCMQYAAASGAMCVTAYDSISGLLPIEELDKKIAAGWPKLNS